MGIGEGLNGAIGLLVVAVLDDHFVFLVVSWLDSWPFSDFAMLHEKFDCLLLQLFGGRNVALDDQKQLFVGLFFLIQAKSADALDLPVVDAVDLSQNYAIHYLLVLHLDIAASIRIAVSDEGFGHDHMGYFPKLGEIGFDAFLGYVGIDTLEEYLVVVVVGPDVQGLSTDLDFLELVELFAYVTPHLHMVRSTSK